MKDVLAQCDAIRKEISDCQRRAAKLQGDLDNLDVVADVVTGTRPDGTFGPIKVRGIPDPEYRRKKISLVQAKAMHEKWAQQLLDKLNDAEQFIESLPDSKDRTMLRLYAEGRTWKSVAKRMNELFPGGKHTEDSCRMRYNRLMKGGGQDGKV